MTAVKDRLIESYLQRLEKAARLLPRRERQELLDEIRGHVSAGVNDATSEADVRNLLEELGAPEDIVDAALPDKTRAERGGREVAAVLLLTFGMFLWGIGWFVGIALLLMSPVWKGWQKALGILGAPIAIIGAGLASWATFAGSNANDCSTVGSTTSCTLHSASAGWLFLGPLSFLLVGFLVQVGISTYLYIAAGRQSRA